MAGISLEKQAVPLSPEFKKCWACGLLNSVITKLQKCAREEIAGRLQTTNRRLKQINTSLEKELSTTK